MGKKNPPVASSYASTRYPAPDDIFSVIGQIGGRIGRVSTMAGIESVGDTTLPPGVTGLAVTGALVRSVDGVDSVTLTASWNALQYDLSDAEITTSPDVALIKGYLVSYSTFSGYSRESFVEGTTVTIPGLPVASSIMVRVRAVSMTETYGPYSTASATIARDTVPPPAPTTPVVTAVTKGVTITWDGLFAGGAAKPSDFSHVLIEYHYGDNAWLKGGALKEAGTHTLATTGLSSVTVRLSSYDISGNASAASASATATARAVHNEDVLAQAIDTRTLGDLAVVTGKLGPGAVTTEKIIDSAITAAKVGFVVGGGNQLLNSSFEVDSNADGVPDSWTLASGTVSTTQGVSIDTTATNFRYGAKALKIAAATAANYYVHQQATLTKGKWRVSTWVKRTSVAGATGSGMNIDMVSGTATATGGNQASGFDLISLGTNDWQRESVLLDITSDSAVVRLYLQQGYGSGGSTGTTWFDGVQVEQGDIVTAYAPRPDEILAGTITATELADGAVSTLKLVDNAITQAKIADNAVGTAEIVASAVTAAKTNIAALSNSTGNLNINTVNTTQLVDLAITTGKVAASAITSSKVGFTVGGGNFMTNSSFESPAGYLSGWGGSVAQMSSVAGRTGGAAVRITSSAYAYLTRSLGTLQPGTYKLTAYFKANALTSANYGIAIENIGSGNTAATDLRPASALTHTAWVRHTATLTIVNAAAPTLILTNQYGGSGVTGTVDIDDVQLEYGDVVTAYAPKVDEILPSTVTATEILDGAVGTNEIAAAAVVTAKIAPLAITAPLVGFAVGGGNLFANSSFEDATALWGVAGSAPPTVASSTAQAQHGTRSQLTTWQTGSTSATAGTNRTTPLAAGTYVFSAWLYVPAGSTAAKVQAYGTSVTETVTTNRTTTVTGAWQRRDVTFTVSASTTAILQVAPDTATAAGSTVYVDSVQLERGDILTSYAPKPDEILPGTVGTTEIAALAITAPKISVPSIDSSSGNLTANSVTTNTIAANAITAAKIAADTITANEIAASAITANELAANSVTAAKIVADTITANEIASSAITTNELSANAVTAAKIAANTITAAEIAADTITATQIAANAITASEISANAVTAGKIAADAVTANEIAANAITTSELSANSVTAAAIAANAVTANKLLVTVGGGNLLSNSNFANGTTGWTNRGSVTFTVVADTAVYGSTAVEFAVDVAGEDIGIYHTTVPVEPSTPVTGSIYVNRVAGTAPLRIGVEWFTTAGAYISGTYADMSVQATTGVWKRYSITGTAPANAGRAGLMVYTGSGTAVVGDTWRLKAAQLERGDVPSAYSPLVDEILPGTIVASHIATDTITATQIAADAITTTELAASAVTAAKISANTITAAQIASNTLTANEIAADAISTSELAANAITAGKIAAGAITSEKLTIGAMSDNLIVNGGFEDALTASPTLPAGWTTNFQTVGSGASNVYLDSAAAGVASGTQSLTIQTPDAASGQAIGSAAFPVVPGTSLYVSATVRSALVNANTYIRLMWGTAQGMTRTTSVIAGSGPAPTEVKVTDLSTGTVYTPAGVGGTAHSDLVSAYPVPSTNKLRVEGQVVVPAGATWARFALYGWNSSAGNYWTFDDAVVRRVTVSAQIGDGAITTPKLVANAVTAAQIAADTITAGQIAASAITSNELAANAVIAGKIAAGTIVANDIAATTITAAKIAADTITAGQIAADAITTTELAANAVTAAKITAGTIDASKISANTLTANEIAANAISTSELAANAVTATAIAANAVTAEKIVAGAITTSRLTVASLTPNLIANGGFEEGLDGWGHAEGASAGSFYVEGASDYWGTSGTQHAIINTSGGYAVSSAAFPVSRGERLFASIRVGSTTPSANWYWRFFWYASKPADTGLSPNGGRGHQGGAQFVVGGYTDLNAGPSAQGANPVSQWEAAAIVPVGARWARVAVYNWVNGADTYMVLDDVFVSKATVGTQITDGAVTTGKLAANAVTANQIAAGAITADKISADAITGKTITGGLFRTRTSGARIEIQSTANNEIYFHTEFGSTYQHIVPKIYGGTYYPSTGTISIDGGFAANMQPTVIVHSGSFHSNLRSSYTIYFGGAQDNSQQVFARTVTDRNEDRVTRTEIQHGDYPGGAPATVGLRVGPSSRYASGSGVDTFASLFHSGINGGNAHLDSHSATPANGNGLYLAWISGSTTNGAYVNIGNGAGAFGNIKASAFTVSSEGVLKSDIKPLAADRGLAAVRKMKPVSFKPVDRTAVTAPTAEAVDAREISFVAEEIGALIPEAASWVDGKITGYHTNMVIPVLAQALKEADAEMAAMRAELTALKSHPAIAKLLSSKIT